MTKVMVVITRKFVSWPGSLLRFAFDMRPIQAQSQGFAVDALPPGYRWFRLNADGSVETGVVRVQSDAAGLDMASLGY